MEITTIQGKECWALGLVFSGQAVNGHQSVHSSPWRRNPVK